MSIVTRLAMVAMLAVCGWSMGAGEESAAATGLLTAGLPENGLVEVEFLGGVVAWNVSGGGVSVVQVEVRGPSGALLFDSGLTSGATVDWPLAGLLPAEGPGVYRYVLRAWGAERKAAGAQAGELRFTDDGNVQAVAMGFDVPGNFTIGGYLGIGTDTPERAVHIVGSNAVFRMDRSTNSAAFMMVRTDAGGVILKNYVLGVDAYGPNNGRFVINDLGQTIGGAGNNRMTIDNSGNTTFTGNVTATQYTTTSSIRFKTDVQPLDGALDMVLRLQGVRFRWKDTGEPSLGLIAEEAGKVVPELVQWEPNGVDAVGFDYGRLSALLVEASREQEAEIRQLQTECASLKTRWQAELAALQSLIGQTGDSGK